MNYWCNTCNCYKGAIGADECAVDGHSIVPAKDRELKIQTALQARLEIIEKLGYAPSSISSPEWIVSRVQMDRDAFKGQIAGLKEVIHTIHGTLDAVLHSADPVKSMNTWLPLAIKDCRKALGIPVPETPPLTEDEKKVLKEAGFTIWTPKIGDRVWVSGKTWESAGTIIGFAKDDPEVPWIKVDKDGTSWDARDCGSVRQLKDKDK